MNSTTHILANLEELTNKELMNFTEQLLDLLTPAGKEQLLNLNSLNSVSNSISSGFLEKEIEGISTEELTSKQLTELTEQLLDLLTPAGKEQLLNLNSLNSVSNSISSGFLEKEIEGISTEELTSKQLTELTEQLLDLLNPAGKEQLLNLDSLNSVNNSTSSNFLEGEIVEISRKEVEDYLDEIAARELYLEKQREFKKRYRKKINSDPIAKANYLKKQRESKRKRQEIINSDPITRAAYLKKQREFKRKHREKINSNPEAKKIFLEKEKERNKKRRKEIYKDPIAKELYLKKQRESKRKRQEIINSDPIAKKINLEKRVKSLNF